MGNCIITGLGSYFPPRVVTNEEIAMTTDTSPEWIQSRTGIKQRHFAHQESTVDMAYQAALIALKRAQCNSHDLDLIIFATVTPDYRLPSAACLLQEKLGAKNAAAFDISAACAGSLYALAIAQGFFATGTYKKILVIGAETLSSIINWADRNTCVLFGDGASAAMLEQGTSSTHGLLAIKLFSDGTHWQDLHIRGGGSKHPLTRETLLEKDECVRMNGRETFKFAVRALTEATQIILNETGLTINNVDTVIAHQANLRIITAVAERTEIPLSKFVINIDKYANTSSASLFATFDEAHQTGRVRPNDHILLMAIGAGFSWGAAIYRA